MKNLKANDILVENIITKCMKNLKVSDITVEDITTKWKRFEVHLNRMGEDKWSKTTVNYKTTG
jgi:hypothetical protein